MSTEIYILGFVALVMIVFIFANNRWPEMFESNDDDPPIFPMA